MAIVVNFGQLWHSGDLFYMVVPMELFNPLLIILAMSQCCSPGAQIPFTKLGIVLCELRDLFLSYFATPFSLFLSGD